jgi:hypothetical protein
MDELKRLSSNSRRGGHVPTARHVAGAHTLASRVGAARAGGLASRAPPRSRAGTAACCSHSMRPPRPPARSPPPPAARAWAPVTALRHPCPAVGAGCGWRWCRACPAAGARASWPRCGTARPASPRLGSAVCPRPPPPVAVRTTRFTCWWRRPTGRERMDSPTLQTLRDPILLTPLV